jgi:putative endonuclease
VVAGVLFDYACLRDHRVRPLAGLNDSKQLTAEEREEVFRGVMSCAQAVTVRAMPSEEIDRNGLHRSNLDGMRSCLRQLAPPAEACLVDGFRLGPACPAHTAVVDGVRLLVARRLHHAAALGGRARAGAVVDPPALVPGALLPVGRRAGGARAGMNAVGRRAELRARLHYLLRGYRLLAWNTRVGGVEVDLIARRGRRLVFVEVKAKRGGGFGDPAEMVGWEKQERLRRAAAAWLAAHPEAADWDVQFDVVAVTPSAVRRIANAF